MKTLMIPALLALAACGQPPAPHSPVTVEIAGATCRPTLNGRDMTGCYLTLTASGDDRLVSVGAPLAQTAQIHEMKVEGGMMKMAELKNGLVLPAGRPVQLKPGGSHLMLMGLTQPLAEGEQVSITLNFEHAQPTGIRAIVAQPSIAAASPAAR